MIGIDSSESILLLKRAFKHMHFAVTVSSDVLGCSVCVYHGLAIRHIEKHHVSPRHGNTTIGIRAEDDPVRHPPRPLRVLQGHLGWRVSCFHCKKIAKESLKGLGDVHRHRCPGNSNPIFDVRWFSFGSSWPNPGISSQCDVTWCDHMKLDQPRDRGKCLEMSRKWCQDVPRPCDRLVFPLSGWMVVIGCVTMTIAANAKKEKRDAVVRHATTCMLPSPNTLDRPCAGWSFADIQPRMEKSNIPFTSFYILLL